MVSDQPDFRLRTLITVQFDLIRIRKYGELIVKACHFAYPVGSVTLACLNAFRLAEQLEQVPQCSSPPS